MSRNKFESSADSLTAPAQTCFAIQPHDDLELSTYTKAIYIGQSGDIVVRSVRSDTDVTFRNVPAGYILDVRIKAVRATGTTAADIVGLA